MNEDPIVDEIRRAGDAYFRRFNYDARAAMDELRRRNEQDGRRVVSLPPKRSATSSASPHTAGKEVA